VNGKTAQIEETSASQSVTFARNLLPRHKPSVREYLPLLLDGWNASTTTLSMPLTVARNVNRFRPPLELPRINCVSTSSSWYNHGRYAVKQPLQGDLICDGLRGQGYAYVTLCATRCIVDANLLL